MRAQDNTEGVARLIDACLDRNPIWSPEHKRIAALMPEYAAWAKRVVDGFTIPNPVLKAEFDKTVALIERALPSQESVPGEPTHPISRIIDTTEESLETGITGIGIVAGVPSMSWLL